MESRGKHTAEGPAKSWKTTWDVLYERSIYNAADVILTCCVLHWVCTNTSSLSSNVDVVLSSAVCV